MQFELLESLFNIDYFGVHIPLEQVFSVRQVLKHKPFSIRPAYFHSCVPSHYLIFVGRDESEVRSVRVVSAGFGSRGWYEKLQLALPLVPVLRWLYFVPWFLCFQICSFCVRKLQCYRWICVSTGVNPVTPRVSIPEHVCLMP